MRTFQRSAKVDIRLCQHLIGFPGIIIGQFQLLIGFCLLFAGIHPQSYRQRELVELDFFKDVGGKIVDTRRGDQCFLSARMLIFVQVFGSQRPP